MDWYSQFADTYLFQQLEETCDRTRLPIYFQKIDHDAGYNLFVTEAKTVDNAADMLRRQLKDLRSTRRALATHYAPELLKLLKRTMKPLEEQAKKEAKKAAKKEAEKNEPKKKAKK